MSCLKSTQHKQQENNWFLWCSRKRKDVHHSNSLSDCLYQLQDVFNWSRELKVMELNDVMRINISITSWFNSIISEWWNWTNRTMFWTTLFMYSWIQYHMFWLTIIVCQNNNHNSYQFSYVLLIHSYSFWSYKSVYSSRTITGISFSLSLVYFLVYLYLFCHFILFYFLFSFSSVLSFNSPS